jgi:glycine/D-amino acid oxidase-like deaminating enzyme
MIKTDIAIVGGGIIGIVIAREIIKNTPDASIAIFEKRILGSGSSFYSAGVHFPRGINPRVQKMSLYSHNYYQEFIGGNTPIYPLTMELITHSAHLDKTLSNYLPLAEFTPVITSLNSDIELSGQKELAILQGKGGHYTDVFKLVNLFMHELRLQIDIHEGVSVDSLQRQGNGYLLGLSSGEQVIASKVILAPGPWLAEPAWRDRIADLGVRIKKIVAVHIAQVPAADAPLTIFHDDDAFLLPFYSRNHWLFSYTCQEWDMTPKDITALQSRDIETAKDVLSRYSPTLAQSIHDGRVFCDTYSASREPIITQLDDGLIYAGGANGSGYRLAPAIASEVIALLSQTNA